ncbi:hypothetical protein N657DRAFT_631802 [Parathielavia appendiculata]|uniref:Uncharacterized protein n=1 Tax=Parathielavia appendiculata TaxID=2587402 RepID=A0AAN6Z617_9PEZI|nr:hypothetical protein N657DRAFT_631802 [Parathielavia appendiculata]
MEGMEDDCGHDGYIDTVRGKFDENVEKVEIWEQDFERICLLCPSVRIADSASISEVYDMSLVAGAPGKSLASGVFFSTVHRLIATDGRVSTRAGFEKISGGAPEARGPGKAPLLPFYRPYRGRTWHSRGSSHMKRTNGLQAKLIVFLVDRNQYILQHGKVASGRCRSLPEARK